MKRRPAPRAVRAAVVAAVEGLESRRLLAGAGDLDPTFSGDGLVTSNLPASAATDVVVQADGKILVAAVVGETDGTGTDAMLLRYNADGTPDTGFSGDGVARFDWGGDERFESLALLPDGKIVVGGTLGDGRWVLARYAAGGNLDAGSGFGGTDGVQVGTGAITDLALQGSKIITAAGDVVRRHNASGSVDTTFGGAGTGQITLAAALDMREAQVRDVDVQADGKVVLTGHIAGDDDDGDAFYTFVDDVIVARLNADGTVDAGFGNRAPGVASWYYDAYDRGEASAFQSDGKIIVAVTGDDGVPRIVRLNTNGTLDTSWPHTPAGELDGVGVPYQFNSDYYVPAVDVAVMDDDRVVVANFAARPYDAAGDPRGFAAARFTAGGVLDGTFSGDGTTSIYHVPPREARPNAMALAPGGKLVIAGFAGAMGATSGELTIARVDNGDTPGGRTAYRTTDSGYIVVDGTSADDAISLRKSGTDLVVEMRNVGSSTVVFSRMLTMASFDRGVVVRGFGGDDDIWVHNAESIPGLRVEGGDGDDDVTGSIANDTLDGGAGNDTLRGVAGNDRFFAADGEADTVNGGSGTDTADADHADSVSNVETVNRADDFATVDGTTLTVNGTGGADVIELTGAEDLSGPVERDVIYVSLNGTTRAFDRDAITHVRLLGHGGADEIELGFYSFSGSTLAPFVTAEGGDGDDFFEVYEGYGTRHALYGGAGDDRAAAENGSIVVPNFVDGGAGSDSVHASHVVTIDMRTMANVEDAFVPGGTVIGNALDNYIEVGGDGGTALGGDGNDTLFSGAADDGVTLDGGPGDDSLRGADGDDTLIGGPGNDRLSGWGGNDLIQGGEGDDDLIADDEQADTVDGGAGNDAASVDRALDVWANVETVNGEPVDGTEPVLREVIADATVRYGSYANQNFGDAGRLQVKENPDSSYDRTAYLKFSLSGVPADAGGVKLRLHGYVADSSNAASVTVHGVSDTSWSQSGITAANAPAYGGALSSTLVDAIGAGSADYFEWDVTEYVRRRVAAGATAVSFAVRTSANIRVDFTSGENWLGRPMLVAYPPAGEPQVVTRAASADAHVRGGTNANANYGGAQLLEVKDADNPSNDRVAYLRFDLSGLTGAGSAVLRLYGYVSDLNQPTSVGVYAAGTSPWGEQALTWNTAPSVGALLATRAVTGFGSGDAAWYAFDVTPHVGAALDAGASSVTLAVRAATNGDVRVMFQSDENANRPELVIET